jgi:hypothetical protein
MRRAGAREPLISPLRSETFRRAWRKSLKLRWAPNRAFRGIVCFQWLNWRFVSSFPRLVCFDDLPPFVSQRPFSWPSTANPLARGAHKKREPALPILLKNRNMRQPARQENVDSFYRALAFFGRALSPPCCRPVDPWRSAAEPAGSHSRRCATEVTLSSLGGTLDQMLTAAKDPRGFVEGMSKEDFLADKRTQQAVNPASPVP